MIPPIDPAAGSLPTSARVTNSALSAGVSRRTVLQGGIALAAALATGGLLSGCGGGKSSSKVSSSGKLRSVSTNKSQSGTVTLWVPATDLAKVFASVIPAFNAVYPNIKVNQVQVAIDTKLPPTLVSGAGVPDGAFWGDTNIPGQAAHFADLSDVMAQYKSDIVPYKVDVNTVNGRLVGVPWDTDPGLLYYREDLLNAAGVDPTTLTSYDSLLTAARALKAKNPNAKPIPLEQDPGLSLQWLEMFANQQQGVGMVDKSNKLHIDSDAYRNALTWIKAVSDEGLGTRQKFANTADVASLDDGTQSLCPWAVWWIFLPQGALKTSVGKWRVTSLPSWTPSGARSGVMGGSSFVIPAKAKNPDLAWLFYEFLVFNKTGYTAGFGKNATYPGGLNTVVPSYTPALDPATPLFSPISQLGNEPLWQTDIAAVKQIPAGYFIPTWFNQASTYLGANLQQLMDGKMSVDDVISKSSDEIQKNLINRA